MSVDKEYYKLKIIFSTPVLGAQSRGDVMAEYVAKKRGVEIDEDEAAMIPDTAGVNTTVFHRDESGEPVMMPHQVKGFLKEAAAVLNGKTSAKTRNLRSKVRQTVFVTDTVLKLHPEEKGAQLSMQIELMSRPLRREGMYGPKTTLTQSEMLPAGVWFECSLEVYPGEVNEEMLRDILDYGFNSGLGQWRDGGYGRFQYKLVKED